MAVDRILLEARKPSEWLKSDVSFPICQERIMKIYVGGLAYSATEGDLRDAFSVYGEVAEAIVIKDRDTGRSKGFGFVDMPDPEQAEKAISGMDGQPILGRTVRVNEARPREERPPRREGGGGRRPGGRDRF